MGFTTCSYLCSTKCWKTSTRQIPWHFFVVSQKFTNFNPGNLFVISEEKSKVLVANVGKYISMIELICTSEIVEISDFQAVKQSPSTQSSIRLVKKSDN
jgi:hypothetical protein